MSEVAGFGTVLETGDKGDGTSTVWTAIARIVDIEPPEEEVDDMEATAHDSPSKAREFAPGLVNNGEAKATIRFSAARFTSIRALKGVVKDFRITFNDMPSGGSHGSRLQINSSYVKKVGPKTPLDKLVEVEIAIKVSGEPAFTAAA